MIQNCDVLTELCVGSHSMEEWKKCLIEDCPMLVTITVERGCFCNTPKLSLVSWSE